MDYDPQSQAEDRAKLRAAEAEIERMRAAPMIKHNADLIAQVRTLSLQLGAAEHELSEEKIRADGAVAKLAAADAAVEEANRRCAQDPCVKDSHVGIEDLLDRAFTEIRRQVFGSKVVFDREIVDMADARDPGNRWEGAKP